MIRRSPHRCVLGVAALATTVALAACGGPSDADRRRELAEDLVRETDGVLDGDTARCVADGLFEAFGDESLDTIVAVAEGGDDPDGVRARVVDVFAACDALGAVAVPGG